MEFTSECLIWPATSGEQPQVSDQIEHEKINSIFSSIHVLFRVFHEQSKLRLDFYYTQRS